MITKKWKIKSQVNKMASILEMIMINWNINFSRQTKVRYLRAVDSDKSRINSVYLQALYKVQLSYLNSRTFFTLYMFHVYDITEKRDFCPIYDYKSLQLQCNFFRLKDSANTKVGNIPREKLIIFLIFSPLFLDQWKMIIAAS